MAGVLRKLRVPRERWLIGFCRRSQVGTLHKSLVRAEAAALSPQCREASGLSPDSLARAESLDKVLQQVSAWAGVCGCSAGPRGLFWARQEARPGALRPIGRGGRTGFCLKLRLLVCGCLCMPAIPGPHLTLQPSQASIPAEGVGMDGGYGIGP